MSLVILMAGTTPFEDFDHWTYDFVVVHAGLKEPGKQIVLVDFDDATFVKYPQYPLPRDLVALVVQRVGEQQPRVAGMDILLSEPRSGDEDKALQQALTKAGRLPDCQPGRRRWRTDGDAFADVLPAGGAAACERLLQRGHAGCDGVRVDQSST